MEKRSMNPKSVVPNRDRKSAMPAKPKPMPKPVKIAQSPEVEKVSAADMSKRRYAKSGHGPSDMDVG
jgi:hypothetical protein